jgi:lipopolysaccharide export LptBFGC system permease protein LptF
MQGVAIALGLGIGYYLLNMGLAKMGEAELLPPLIGAWGSTGLAILFAVNRLTTLRT